MFTSCSVNCNRLCKYTIHTLLMCRLTCCSVDCNRLCKYTANIQSIQSFFEIGNTRAVETLAGGSTKHGGTVSSRPLTFTYRQQLQVPLNFVCDLVET